MRTNILVEKHKSSRDIEEYLEGEV